MNTTLASIAELLRDKDLLVRAENLSAETSATTVTGCDCDNRVPNAGHIFVCKGHAFKTAYLTSALGRGAVAYLCDESRADEYAAAAPGVPALVVSDIRRAMAEVAVAAFGHPDRCLTMVGITGTKGKSTTAYMLRAMIEQGSAEPRAAIMGSIETFDGVEREASLNTTPEAPDLWRHIANARDAGLSHMVMEVSSQALKYDRVAGLELDVAAFLNIGRDHISPIEHPNFEDYFESKLRIFRQARCAVVNKGTDLLDRVLEAARQSERLLTFSIDDPTADVWASDVRPDGAGMRFTAHTPSWEGEVALSLAGMFNVENALAALAMAEAIGLPCDKAQAGLANVSVPGRMEVIESTDGMVTGIVDFAHNKMAFSRFFPAVRKQFPGRPIVSVFGAVGDKALERREELPAEAARWSTHLVFTEDDPGTEPVADICAAMEAATPSGVPCETVLDREDAVRRAVDIAYELGTPAVVCVLCRGTEPTQHRGTRFEPAPLDADLLRDAFARHGG